MKLAKWPLLLVLLFINQLVRSPFHIWNWTSEISLWSSNYESVLYESSTAHIEVLERAKVNPETEALLMIVPDMHSPIGSWEPFLDTVQFDGTIRFLLK